MERAYKVWGNVLSVILFGSVVLGIVGLVLLLSGQVSPLVGSLTVMIFPLIGIYMMGHLLRTIILGEALEKKYSPPQRSVSVTVNDLSADSLLYRQGLRSSDVVVAANGEILKDDTFSLQTWWQNQDSINLTVLRDSQELQVTLRKE